MMSRIGRRAIITPIIALPIFLLLFHATLSYFPPFDDTGERVPNPTYGFLFRTGRMAWPGTYVVVKPIYDDTALLERRWLFLWEARQTLTHDPVEGWILASEVSFGPARIAQVITLVILSILIAITILLLVRRRRRALELPSPREEPADSG
jgi:hypothetical protein